MTVPELSRPIDVRQAAGRQMAVTANPAEREALARRFGIVRIDRLEASALLHRDGQRVRAEGELAADIVQSCAVSGDDIAVSIREPIALDFVPAAPHQATDEVIELDAGDCDEIEYEGHVFDLGEAVAQTLALAIDPFATGPNAEAARKAAGLGSPEDQGPFAALKGLRLDGRD